MAQRGLEVVGLDISEPMLNEARGLGGPTYFSAAVLSADEPFSEIRDAKAV
jgi:hypothetical protein